MFDVLLSKIFQNSLKNHNFKIERVGKKNTLIPNDLVGCRDYLLKGEYTYNQVMELNSLTGYNAGFGYSRELGSVAFIGIPDIKKAQNSGYFSHKVQEYGQPIDNEKYYFEMYSDYMAKYVTTYTVYGMGDPILLENKVLIDKINYCYDYRYKRKQEHDKKFKPDVLKMDIKISGTYGFNDIRKLVHEYKDIKEENIPIQFAIVDNNPIGILNLWRQYDNVLFRDVWSLNEKEPDKLPIHFLKIDEAKKINNFKLYYFTPIHSSIKKQFEIEKIDRTLIPNFNFIMDDGIDYRLQDIQKVKVKTLNKKVV